jgi:hypothetical protein
MRTLVCAVSLGIAVAFVQGSAAAGQAPPGAGVSIRVAVHPPVVRLHQHATIAVSGLHVRSLQVRLVGATFPDGAPISWRSLRLVGRVWRGSLPAPALLGVYPIVLRFGSAAAGMWPRLFLRVFARGTRARPSFDDPADVVRWWVRTVPHAKLVALKAWPRPGFDRRDVRMHRLFVVAYSPPGHPPLRDRLGMFITVFRDGYGARWQLLEATVEP